MNKFLKLFFFVSILCFAFASCQDNYNICELSKDVKMKAGLYVISGGVEQPTTATSFTMGFLNAGSLIYNERAGISKFSAVLNSVVDTSKYFIRLSPALQPDTLSVIYTSQSSLLSTECGYVMINNITKAIVTNHTIDSVVLINPENNTTSTENIKVYF